MRLKDCKELKVLAEKSGLTTNQVSEIIITQLVNNKLIESIPENMGLRICDILLNGYTEFDIVCFVIGTKYKLGGIKIIFTEIIEFYLMGNDDCPECGGQMEVTDGQYKNKGGDGYTTPPEYTPIWETKKCSNCGHEESNEPNY